MSQGGLWRQQERQAFSSSLPSGWAIAEETEGSLASNSADVGCGDDTDLENQHRLIIFRVPHKRPHGLKRPLQHTDDLTGLDFAVRLYAVVTETQGPGASQDTFKVQRMHGSDVKLMELCTSTCVDVDDLIQSLKQWSLQPGMCFDTGLCFFTNGYTPAVKKESCVSKVCVGRVWRRQEPDCPADRKPDRESGNKDKNV